MAEYDLVEDVTNKGNSVSSGISTIDSGINDINEVTNIVEYYQIYHDPNASDSDRREAMKKMAYSFGYFGNKIPATSGGAYFYVLSSEYVSDGFFFADKEAFITELSKSYDYINPYNPRNKDIEYMIDHPDESYEA